MLFHGITSLSFLFLDAAATAAERADTANRIVTVFTVFGLTFAAALLQTDRKTMRGSV
jgi:hypothetical protein